MTSHSPILEAVGASYTYPDGVVALEQIDLSIHSGSRVALLAANGSGKTTLIRLLTGLLKPNQGQIRLMGQPLSKLNSRDIYEKIGVVFQDPGDQLFASTVEEDVAFGPRNLGLSEAQVELRVQESLLAVDALHLRKRAVHRLSFGEQRRVAVAGVLAMTPSILILDEPTAGLDPLGELAMIDLLNAINRDHGTTILMATHAVDLLPMFAQTVVVLDSGRIVQHGTPAEVFSNDQVTKRARLRLPYIAALMHEMKIEHGMPLDGLPLTIPEARQSILKLMVPISPVAQKPIRSDR